MMPLGCELFSYDLDTGSTDTLSLRTSLHVSYNTLKIKWVDPLPTLDNRGLRALNVDSLTVSLSVCPSQPQLEPGKLHRGNVSANLQNSASVPRC